MKTPIYKLLLISLLSLLLLGALSFVPWGDVSGGKLHDFNLLADIMVAEADTTSAAEGPDASLNDLDPELARIMETSNDDADSMAVIAMPMPVDSAMTGGAIEADVQPEQAYTEMAAKSPREGELVIIEDYTPEQRGLANLRSALSSGRVARIAVVGDSYIEGDILTQDLREMLQNRYGGSGVGYVNMHSEFPGFRQSVRQSGTGWKEHDFKKGKKDYIGLPQHYFTVEGKATASYKGVNKLQNLDRWDSSKFLFISPEDAEIRTRVDGETEWTAHSVSGSDAVQQIAVNSPTGKFEVETSSPGVIGLGVWMDGTNGIAVDCMSSRGISGISLANIDDNFSAQLSRYIPYDLIILEFGMNAMSAKQTNYSVYGKQMAKVVEKLRRCYPSTDILVMGIGDRGQKIGGEVHSMATVNNMIGTQRDVARRTGTLFWDTREAMGGVDAVVRWNREGNINKDYVHLSHKGGKKLAEPLFNAITNNLEK